MPSLFQIARGNAGDLTAALAASAACSLGSSAAVRAARGRSLFARAPRPPIPGASLKGARIGRAPERGRVP